jgi:succinate dehydrogenase / fumarate reductase flavoprotein subunit
MSSVPGLFACGECAAGMHGANRLGGNSLSDLLVFGRLAGLGAIRYIGDLKVTPRIDATQVQAAVQRATAILNREQGTNPYLIHEALQDLMGRGVGIVRTEEELKTALDELDKLKEETSRVKAHGASQYNPGWHAALDLRSLLITAEAVARGALLRQESRGAHTRVDYPGEQKEWQKVNIVSRKGKDGMETRKVERPDPTEELRRIAYATLEELEGTHA